MPKAIIYVRVSSKEQKQEGYSIPAQKKLLADYAKANDFDVVKEFKDDETAKSAGRTGFGLMIEFIRNNTSIFRSCFYGI
jgi:site-specific DNA recombinase